MRLLDFLEKTNSVDKKYLQGENALKLLNFMEAGINLSTLVAQHRELVAPLAGPQLRRLSDARRLWQELEILRESILAQFPDVPDEVFALTLSVRRMEALRHLLPLFPQSDFSSREAYLEALRAALEVWTGALNNSTKKGTIKAAALRQNLPEYLENIVEKPFDIFSLPRDAWLAMKRGESSGNLRLEFEYPISSITTHLDAVKNRMGSIVSRLSSQELLNAVVLSHLHDALRRFLDNRMREESLKETAVSYLEVLKVPPVKAQRLGAFFPDSASGTCGLVALNDKGKVLAYAVLPLADDWCERARVFFVEQKTAYVVVPFYMTDYNAILEEFREKEGGFLVFMPVRADGMSEAIALLEKSGEATTGPSSGATVLGRRFMFPAREWASIDPIAALGGDIPEDIPEDEVRAYLLEQKGLILMDAGLDRIPPRVLPTAHSGGLLAAGKLNPNIQSFEDVKMGMQLTGIIINITKFGAFVNIGLSQEALVHVSELSDNFISDPFEAVSLGQQVKATVVGIDTEKRRISLSLRSNPKPVEPRKPREEASPRRPKVPLDDRPPASPAARSQALRDLENLFKK